MKKLSKSAKSLDAFFSVLYWVILVGSCIIATLTVVAMVIGSDSRLYHNVASQINIGGIILTPASDYIPTGSDAYIPLICNIITLAICAIVVCFGIKILRNILKSISNGEPFAKTVSINLKKLGWLTLFGGFSLSSCDVACRVAKLMVYNVLDLIKTDKISQITVNYYFDITFIVVAFLLFMLSYVFRHGEELQTLSDETL